MGKKAAPLTSNPFAKLVTLRVTGGVGPAERRAPAAAESNPAPEDGGRRGPARAVVRYERKGRAGKEATVVEKLGLDEAELGVWCKELKAALGCGGAVDDASIVLQGDQRSRLEPLLSARGVRKVTVS